MPHYPCFACVHLCLLCKVEFCLLYLNSGLILSLNHCFQCLKFNLHLNQVTRLCDLTTDNDTVTSVSWAERGNLVAVGTHRGYVQIWDVTANKKLNVLEGHSARLVRV